MKIAIIGCGLIGEKRLKSLSLDDEVLFFVDTDYKKAQRLTDIHQKGKACINLNEVLNSDELEAAIIATTNEQLALISSDFIKRGVHVLVEKPASRNLEDLNLIKNALLESKAIVKVGFNHRFHPAIEKAHAIVSSGKIGPLMYIRARYGHGGRLGYEKEWRWNKSVSGGGELLDQGVHLIDLASWFMQDNWDKVEGQIETYFWDTKLEDNGFMHLSSKGRVAWLHVSATEWKNLFSFEIFCKYGKLQIDGLGGSYGVERLTQYRMLPEMGPPETTSWEYPFPDDSWKKEFEYFKMCIQNQLEPEGGIAAAEQCLSVIDVIYQKKDEQI
jgi:predicted dehydrogenase